MADAYRIVFVSDPTFEQTYGLHTLDELKTMTREQLKIEEGFIKQKIADVIENRKRVVKIARDALILLRRRLTFVKSLHRRERG
jgi:hypothetical protein